MHVEVGDRDQRHKELQGGRTKEEVPVVEELSVALPFLHRAAAGHILPQENCWAVEEEGKDPDGHHLDNRVGHYSPLNSVRYL